MLIGVWGYYEHLCKKNYLFRYADSGIGSDLLKPINKLAQVFELNGSTLKTIDVIDDMSEVKALILLDFPDISNKIVRNALEMSVPKYLVIFESELIRAENWHQPNLSIFDKIFTWNDDFVDNKKYFKINFSHQMPATINKKIDRAKLCTMIAGNKKVQHPLELYSKRIEVIRWFEKHHPKAFDLYGMGWKEYHSSNKYVNFALRKLGVTRCLAPKYPSYCGSVTSKKEVLQKYKFSICYENARDISGYITEKIFDCFFAGSVPVYWGANNITDHIPKDCFIDMREFSCYEDMYHYMTSMKDSEYTSYLDAIDLFLHSKAASQFTVDFFVNTIVSNICETNEV